MVSMQSDDRRSLVPVALALPLAVGGLAVDLLWLPWGFTCGLPYVALVLLSLNSPRRFTTLGASVLAALLITAPMAIRLVPFTPATVLDRGVALLGVAVAAVLCLRWKEMADLSRRVSRFNRSIVDTLTAQIAVLDSAGRIVAVNEAWRRLEEMTDGPLAGCAVGRDFLALCRAVSEDVAEEAASLADGIRQVLDLERTEFSLEYPWGLEKARRWYAARVTRFEEEGRAWAVVDHAEITERKQAEMEARRSQAAYRELATHDELTGLLNRRALDRLLEDEVNRFQRYGSPVALLMIDIDHFKAVNDTHGHPVGDAALHWLAGLIAAHVRNVDRAARYGGEEFVVVAPEQTSAQAFDLAERLRRMVADQRFHHRTSGGEVIDLRLTVSVGVASAPGCAEDAATLLAAADEALYVAKRCGRNCSVQHSEIAEHAGH